MCNANVEFQIKIRKINRRPSLGHFTLLFCRRTAKKCTKIYDALAQLLFCSLNLLVGGVLVTVAVVVFLRSQILHTEQTLELFAC